MNTWNMWSVSGVIPTVAVEIPAIPEDVPRLKTLMPVMQDMGVQHLNLHQLRVTLHNAEKLARRGYSFLHGEKVTVLESELAALELLGFSAEGVGLPVNYCAFVYRNRFQQAAARMRSARLVIKPYEDLTAAGLIRSLHLKASGKKLVETAGRLVSVGFAPELWQLDASGDKLLFHPDLWDLIDFVGTRLVIAYQASRIVPGLSYLHPFKELRLSSGRSLFVERIRAGDPVELEGEDIQRYRDRFLDALPGLEIPVAEQWTQLSFCEEIPSGLQEY